MSRSDDPRKGRGAKTDPTNRFNPLEVIADWEHLEGDAEAIAEQRRHPTEFLLDDSKSIVSTNDSPDIPFTYSLNPYRGCEHGCSYCYARPTHEYYGLNAGIDFESKIFVKENAPKLWRDFLNKPGWKGELVVMSGVTDCYQPAERKYQLTRQCLEIALEARQPIGLITKNALIVRDLDILQEMAAQRLTAAAVSITTLQPEIAGTLEPRTSVPQARLRAIEQLSAAGVPVRVMVAPVIPGLNDSEIPAILKAAREAGARFANYQMLRLSGAVRPIFLDWLTQVHPTLRSRVESCIRKTRDGQLNDNEFGRRMRGEGLLADQINQTFKLFARRLGFNESTESFDSTQFRPPTSSSGQLTLF